MMFNNLKKNFKIDIPIIGISFLISVLILSGCIYNQSGKKFTAGFDFAPKEPTILDNIQFIDTSIDPNGNIVKWLWDFGDGYTSIDENPRHQYKNSGTYIIILKVWDDYGKSLSISKNLTIKERPNHPPSTPEFYPESLKSKHLFLPYTFYIESIDPDGDNISYFIDWGDGSVQHTRNVTSNKKIMVRHSWKKPGNYIIRYKAVDKLNGESNWAKYNITISENSSAPDFSIKTLSGETFTLSNYRGKTILLTFGATICGFCRAEIEELKYLSNEFGNKLIIITIDVKDFNKHTENEENLSRLKNDTGADWFFALDTDDTNITGKYIEGYKEYLAIPDIFIINKNGNLSFSQIGYTSRTDLENEINNVI